MNLVAVVWGQCCDGGGAPFEVTFDKDPAGSRLAGKNLTWVRLSRGDIDVGASTITLSIPAMTDSTAQTTITGIRYAWTDFVDCALDNGNSSGIPAGPFRHFF